MTALLQAALLARFSCLQDKCEDTCCKTWSMQVDDATQQRYRTQAPELMDAIEPEAQSPGEWIMRKDPGTACCVKYEQGKCGIQMARGVEFLSDACHFYPRVTRYLAGRPVMTASLSCPEIARLALLEESAPDFFHETQLSRLPQNLRDYAPDGMAAEAALAVHAAFLKAAADTNATAEQTYLRILSVSHSLPMLPIQSWAGALPVYLQLADGRLPPAEPDPRDPFHLLHALAGLIVASHKPMTARLRETLDEMQKALDCTIDWQTAGIAFGPGSEAAWQRMAQLWAHTSAHYEPLLRRYLQMQMSLALFPFAGLGNTLPERAAIIGVRLATIRLAIMCACSIHGEVLPPETVVRIVQSVSRFLDHLGDSAFSLQIYSETGWVREGRMRGLMEQ